MSKSTNFTATGKIAAITDEETRGNYTKRLVVLTLDADTKYPQTVPFTFGGDKALGQVEALRVGDTVTVSFNLRGREYNGRYFLDANGWRAELVKGAPRGAAPRAAYGGGGADDDIPFLTADIAAEPSPIARSIRNAP